MNIKYPLFIAATLFISACGTHSSKEMTMSDDHSMRSKDIIFTEGKLIEIAYVTPIESKQLALKRDYFPKAKPLAKKYGGKMLGIFKVIKKTAGNIDPEMLYVFEWPDVASKKAFDNDASFQSIKSIRDDAFSFKRFAFYKVKEDVTISFQESKVYEFFGAWLKPNGKDKLNEYFKVSAPIKKSYGRPEPVFKAVMTVVENGPTTDYEYTPHMAGIVEWDQSNDFYELINNEDFQDNAAPLMDAALSRIDLIHTKIIIN